MKTIRRRFISAGLLGILFLGFFSGWFPGAISSARPESISGDLQFLVLSDLHFDPYFNCPDGETISNLASAAADQWPNRIGAYQPRAAIQYGQDSPLPLLVETLADAKRRIPCPAFILCGGDFLAHSWQKKYQVLTKRDPATDPQYLTFSTRAVAYLIWQIKQYFPETPFFPVLGNNDSYCGDYQIVPGGQFSAMFAEACAPLLHADSATVDCFLSTVQRGGYYSAPLPQQRRLISLNSVFFSSSYRKCRPDVRMPEAAFEELAFVEQELDRARACGEKVWLLMHIPPGIDGYATSKKNNGSVVTMWQDSNAADFTAKFLSLIDQHRSTLEVAFSGHTHMNDFRLLGVGAEAENELGSQPLILKICPAVSPLFGNNPAYQIFTRDLQGELHFETRYLPLPGDKTAPPTEWKSAPNTLNLSPLSVEKVWRTSQEIVEQPGTLGRDYLQFYYSFPAVPPPPTAIFLDDLSCAMRRIRTADFQKCKPQQK